MDMVMDMNMVMDVATDSDTETVGFLKHLFRSPNVRENPDKHCTCQSTG